MRRVLVIAALCPVLAVPPARGDGGAPVLVELFTSEGCSSCPPADLLLARLVAENPGDVRLIALGEHVDYWDQLGWRDPYSSAVFSQRQEAYAMALRSGVFTPQLVVSGRASVLGSDAGAVRAAISSPAARLGGRIEVQPSVSMGNGIDVRFTATWAPGLAGEIFVALVQDRATGLVARGENGGRTLTHVAIVRSLVKAGSGVGTYSGRAHFPPSRSFRPDRVVVFAQAPGGGPVHAAGAAGLR
jgi:hypothetical protein